MTDAAKTTAGQLGARLGNRTVSCAESCTGGLVAQALAAANGSMEWFAGAVVAYQRRVKESLLGVPSMPLVSRPVAEAMAVGVARLLDTEVAVSVTGAAGPEPLDGAEPGTVVIGTYVDGVYASREYRFHGTPEAVCAQARDAALDDLLEQLGT